MLCEYRLAPGAILHAGIERVGGLSLAACSSVLVSDVPAGFACRRTAQLTAVGRILVL